MEKLYLTSKFFGKILGFIHGRELAKKTMMVYEMCRKLLGTTQFISEEMTQGKESLHPFLVLSNSDMKLLTNFSGKE